MRKLFLTGALLFMALLLISGCEKESLSPVETDFEKDTPVAYRTEYFDLEMLQIIHDAFVDKLEEMQEEEESPFTNDNANGLMPQMDNLQRAIDDEDEEKGNQILQKVILSHLQSLFDDGLFEGFEDDYQELVDIANGIINACPCYSKADLDALDWNQQYSSEGYETYRLIVNFGGYGRWLLLGYTIPDENGDVLGVVHQVLLGTSTTGGVTEYYVKFWANEESIFEGEVTEPQIIDCSFILEEKIKELQAGMSSE